MVPDKAGPRPRKTDQHELSHTGPRLKEGPAVCHSGPLSLGWAEAGFTLPCSQVGINEHVFSGLLRMKKTKYTWGHWEILLAALDLVLGAL